GITSQKVAKLATSVLYHIDNKYYEEDVDFRICHSPKDISEQTFDRVEGVIVFYHKLKPSKVQALWAPWASKIGDDMPELAMCVNVDTPLAEDGVDNQKEGPAFDVNEWCLESGFEHVSVVCGEALRSDAGQSRLTDEDMNGSDRIVEALHCTMWSTMRMKGDKDTGASTRNTSHIVDGDDAEVDINLNEHDDIDTIQPSHDIRSTAEESRTSAQVDADLAAFLTPDEMKFMEGGFFGDDTNPDDPMDNLEKSFMLMNSLKEKVSTLPMEQRHIVAERVAMAFYHAMDGGDSENEEDDFGLVHS
ncbi:hypothetical protein SARC_10635, partial [Sphaeroforma arctica JP610]